MWEMPQIWEEGSRDVEWAQEHKKWSPTMTTTDCHQHTITDTGSNTNPVIVKSLALALLWAGALLEPIGGDRCQPGPFLEDLAVWWEGLGTCPAGQSVHWQGGGGLPGEGDV